MHAHKTARTLSQQTGDTHGEALAWNNLGTTYRDLHRYDEAVVAGRRAAEMLAGARDWFLIGEAWGELATTLSAAGADPVRVREAWTESAAAYNKANAAEEAAASQAHAGVATRSG